MRTWGRVNGTWQEVATAANGDNSAVWLTTLCQALKLNLGESPFYANYGIPAQPSVLTQTFPDYYTNQTVAQFQGYFTSLTAQRIGATDAQGYPYPAYLIKAVTLAGAPVQLTVPT